MLGFEVDTTIPEQAPYVFALMKSGSIQIFLNAPEPVDPDGYVITFAEREA